jgi:hypothetical protein
MFKILLNQHFKSIYVDINCRISAIRLYCDVGTEMKILNDKKQFKQALDLFYESEQRNSEMLTDFAITQALKSVANLKDFKGGSDIHQRYTSRIEKGRFTLPSLIHFYSE